MLFSNSVVTRFKGGKILLTYYIFRFLRGPHLSHKTTKHTPAYDILIRKKANWRISMIKKQIFNFVTQESVDAKRDIFLKNGGSMNR